MAVELISIESLEPVLREGPLAVLCDIDGTVAPIVSHPEDAHISPRAKAALEALIARGVRVAFVTGRALEMARQMVGVQGAYFAANHGINIMTDGTVHTPEAVRPYVEWAQHVIEDVCADGVPEGVIVEDKGPIVAFHYRNAESEPEALAAIEHAIGHSEPARYFRVQHGRKVLELRPPLAVDKGTAVVALARRMGASSVICLGDDATDMDMFRGVDELRLKGVPGASVAVWSPEIAPEVMDATDYWVKGVEGVEWLLEEVLRVLPAE